MNEEKSPVAEKVKNPSEASQEWSESQWKAYVDIFTSTFLAYTFWSTFEVLPSFIWYWSMWDMGLTGVEVVFLCGLFTSLLGSPSIYVYVSRKESAFHVASLLAIVAYQIETASFRLLPVILGYVAGCLVQFMHLIRDRQHAYNWILGIILHGVIKMGFFTLNPMWATMRAEADQAKVVGIAVALVCIAIRSRLFSNPLGQKVEYTTKLSAEKAPSTIGTALSLGAIMWAIHSFMMDSSTLAINTGQPIPNNAADPVSSGVLMLAVVGMCSSLSATYSKVSQGISQVSAAIAATSFLFGHLLYDGREGFGAGLAWVAYVTLMIIPIGTRLSEVHQAEKLGKTLFIAMLWYVVLMLAVIWTFVYKFVPGGEYLRERLDIVWGCAAGSLVIGAVLQKMRPTSTSRRIPSSSKKVIKQYAVILILAGFIVGGIRLANFSIRHRRPRPYGEAENRIITVGVWNVHHGIENRNWASDREVAMLLDDLGIDVIGFYESNLMRAVDTNRDLLQSLPAFMTENKSHYYVDYGPNAKSSTFGCGIMSKFPILQSRHHILPSPQGELACSIDIQIDVWGSKMWVYSVHNGNTEDELDVKLQTAKSAEIVREIGPQERVVFIGYVNTQTQDENYRVLTEDGNLRDIEPKDNKRYNEYIMYRNVKRVAYARVSRGFLSDTELQLARFFVPPETEEQEKSLSEAMIPWITSDDTISKKIKGQHVKEQVPEFMLFPSKYKKPGLREHFYHVFVPKYYKS